MHLVESVCLTLLNSMFVQVILLKNFIMKDLLQEYGFCQAKALFYIFKKPAPIPYCIEYPYRSNCPKNNFEGKYLSGGRIMSASLALKMGSVLPLRSHHIIQHCLSLTALKRSLCKHTGTHFSKRRFLLPGWTVLSRNTLK